MKAPVTLLALAVLLCSCIPGDSAPSSASGAKKASVQVSTDAEGLTVEQRNVRDRLLTDNQPGSIKHLYVVSAWSGDVILYSTVRGKVTSSGKRLTPITLMGDTDGVPASSAAFLVGIGGRSFYTTEVLQDDGTYGSSVDYLFWWDSQGRYHQHYPSGGQIIHVSDQPLSVGRVIINLEEADG